ncbi:hypothetical protein VCV18_006544 [Metarhizium anisopliae]
MWAWILVLHVHAVSSPPKALAVPASPRQRLCHNSQTTHRFIGSLHTMRELFSPRNIAVDTLDTLDTPLVNIIVAPCGEAKTPGRGSAKEVP